MQCDGLYNRNRAKNQTLKQFDLNLNHLTLPEIKDFNALEHFAFNRFHILRL